MRPLAVLLLVALGACAGASAPALEAPPRAQASPAVQAAVAQAKPLFLFAVEKDGLPVSYLHGSVHLLQNAAAARTPTLERAFEGADALVVEVNTLAIDLGAVQAELSQLGVYPDDDDLQQHLTAEQWQQLQPALDRAHLPAAGARRMRPWLLSIVLTMAGAEQAGMSAAQGVDLGFLKLAGKRKPPMEILELETAELQTRIIAGLPEHVQVAMLLDTVTAPADLLRAMVETWRAADLQAMEELIFRGLKEQPDLAPMYEALFDNRNRAMAERLDTWLATGKCLFVVVGAGHLVGDASVVALLQQRGYAVKQVYEQPALRGRSTDPDTGFLTGPGRARSVAPERGQM